MVIKIYIHPYHVQLLKLNNEGVRIQPNSISPQSANPIKSPARAIEACTTKESTFQTSNSVWNPFACPPLFPIRVTEDAHAPHSHSDPISGSHSAFLSEPAISPQWLLCGDGSGAAEPSPVPCGGGGHAGGSSATARLHDVPEQEGALLLVLPQADE